MNVAPLPFTENEDDAFRPPFARTLSVLKKCGTFVVHAGAAVLVLGIVLLMRFGGKETRY